MGEKITKLCKCGCGEAVNQKYKNGPFYDYKRGHYAKAHPPMSNLGSKYSDERKKKISESLKGENNPMYGKTHSKKSKEKMSKAQKGRKHTEETKRKISKAGKGYKHTDEAKKRIGEAHKGQTWMVGEGSPMYGRKHSEETRRKISKSRKGKRKGIPLSDEHKRKIGEGHKGKILTEEIRLKLSKSKKMYIGNIDESHPLWDNFVVPLKLKIRSLIEYKEWREKVFDRDKYACQECGDDKGGNLNAHHKNKGFMEIIIDKEIQTLDDAKSCDDLWDINNGITFCKLCHIEIHKKK